MVEAFFGFILMIGLIILPVALTWTLREIKIILFYLYLWQLKEYHLGRFLDHFRTEKGRKLLWHPLKFVKIFLLTGYLVFPKFLGNYTDSPGAIAFFYLYVFFATYFVYFSEVAVFLRDIWRRNAKLPVLTIKTIFLGILCFVSISWLSLHTILFLGNWETNIFSVVFGGLIIVDILSPLIISILVLSAQPLSVAWRWLMIEKAKRKRREFKNLVVIGITGSYGKTSTKEFLATILSEKFRVAKTSEHQNSGMAIAKTILNLSQNDQVFICEMAAYDKGQVREVAAMAQPKIGIVTGVNQQHLALFGSMAKLISAEGGMELVDSLPENGTAILNGDNETILKTKYKILNTKYCSTKEKLDFWAENIQIEKDWLYFRVNNKEGEGADFKVNLVGAQNIENLLLAAAGAKELGLTLEEIARAAAKIRPEQGTMRLLVRGETSRGGFTSIDSTYSANPDGVLAALDHLKLWPGNKIIIMPCLIELGPAAKEIHQRIGRKIAEVCDLAIITTKDWFEEIKKGALSARMKPESIVFSENPAEIFKKIEEVLTPDSVILLEGRISSEIINKVKVL